MTVTVQDTRALLEEAARQLRDARMRLDAAERVRHEPVAVLGCGLRLPGGDDADGLWALLREGRDAVTPLVTRPDGRRSPPEERVKDGRWAGLLPEVDGFDSAFFGISPHEADRMDPQQRLLLEVAWEAIEDARLPIERLQDERTGVFIGISATDYLNLQLSDPADVNAYTGSGGTLSIAANRLSYVFDFDGPSLALDTACSSSLVALHLACRALRHGDCEFALVAGVNAILSPLSTLLTEKVLPLAPGGRCRTFDASADGIVRAEGCVVLVLERADRARAAGRWARGVVRGTAVNHDGRTNGLIAPNPRAHERVLRTALADAQVDPEDVVYVEAHGTGTALGDPIEIAAIKEVYGAGGKPCALGSVKTNIGHCEAAAGLAGMVKAMLVLEHGEVPPNLHLERLNPEIDLHGTRLTVPTEPTQLAVGARPPLASVSSFGFGGANAHVVLEAAPAVPASERPPGKLVLPLSARCEGALRELALRYADLLERGDESAAAEVCAAAAQERTHHRYRDCVTAGRAAELTRRLRAASERPAPSQVGDDRVAFVFSGQGSQWPRMGLELLEREPVARAEIEACDAMARGIVGWSIVEQLRAPELESRVQETEVAQVTVAALQLGLVALWRSWGIEPYAMTGHSMGEIVAACASGALERRDAFELLVARARIAERMARGGGMACIELPATEVESLLSGFGGRVGIAAVNSPRSIVVSGERPAVDEVVAEATACGAKVRPLRVAYAFHSPMLDGGDAELASSATGVRARESETVLYSTVTGTRIEPTQLDAAHWGRNLRDSVAFRDAMAALARDGVRTFVEVGAHPVLLRDITQTLEELEAEHVAVGSMRRGRSLPDSLDAALAGLYRAGLDVRWEVVMAPPRARVPLPSYPWQHRRHWHVPAVVRPSLNGTSAGGDGDAGVTAVAEAPPRTLIEPSGQRMDALTDYVRDIIVAAAGLEDATDLPPDAPVEELGLDSVAIVELKNQVGRELGVAVPLAALLEGGTSRDLARVIDRALDGGEDETEVAPTVTGGRIEISSDLEEAQT